MSLRIATYNLLVNRVPGIKDRYQKKRYSSDSKYNRVSAWAVLVSMNFSYYVLRNKRLFEPEKYPMIEFKNLYTEGSESSLSKLEDPESFARSLMSYDIISFDVFDTLIFRPLSDPKDLFYFIGQKLNYPNFKWIRTRIEEKARGEKYKRFGTTEVTLAEIYELMYQEAGIDPAEGMQTEVEMERRFCYANPYMKRVVDYLEQGECKVIITSDMYLSKEDIRSILNIAGYPEFKDYYISSDYEISKSDGKLFEKVKAEHPDMSIVHIGDNGYSDVIQAKKKRYRCKTLLQCKLDRKEIQIRRYVSNDWEFV